MPVARPSLWSSIAAIFALAIGLGAQSNDPQTLGPRVGDRVPDFNLPDQTGETRSLQSAMGPKGAVLVFYRSADW
jgi:AhpC/TSA family